MPTWTPLTVASPEAYCYIMDIDNGDQLNWQLMPETITETKSANYTQTPIIGRSLPLMGYANSSSRQMNLTLEFAALEADGEWSPKSIRDKVRWLEAKVYPKYEGGLVYPPPRLLVIVGEALALTAVMTSCSTTWMKPWTVGDLEAYAYRAMVNCTFEEWGANEDSYGHPHSHDDAKAGANQPSGGGGGAATFEIPGAV